jgi:Fe-S oxidoreductase
VTGPTTTRKPEPLDFDQPRVSIPKPEYRFDMQGEMPEPERVERAMKSFVKDFGRTAAIYMESCIHCGMCAEACHFYEVTKDPKYTPIWKLEPFKQAYKREYGPFAVVYRALNLKPKVTVERLQQWQELLYDSCNMCGRCTTVCPMGIDIAELVKEARHGMYAAGLIPRALGGDRARAARGQPLGATPRVFKDRVEWLADDHEVEIPLDKAKADVLCTMSSIEIMKYPDSLVATARVMNHLAMDWTFRTDGYEATNFGLLSGNASWQKEMSMKLIEAAVACGAKTLILPECGHAYTALRWMGANMYGEPLPFKVQHIAEFLAEQARAGRLKLKKLDKTVTFRSLQVVRRGAPSGAARGVEGARRRAARDVPTRHQLVLRRHGVVANHRADELRYKTFKIKMEQIEDTGAEMPVTTCANCRQTFDDGQAHFKWDVKMHSLLELVADHLVEDDA